MLALLARDKSWEHSRARTLGVARGIYLRLPADTMLWHSLEEFVKSEPDALARAFAA